MSLSLNFQICGMSMIIPNPVGGLKCIPSAGLLAQLVFQSTLVNQPRTCPFHGHPILELGLFS